MSGHTGRVVPGDVSDEAALDCRMKSCVPHVPRRLKSERGEDQKTDHHVAQGAVS